VNSNELFQQHIHWATTITKRYCKAFNRRDLDDCLQEVLIALWAASKKYAQGSDASFKSFVFRRVKGAIIDYRRRGTPRGYYRQAPPFLVLSLERTKFNVDSYTGRTITLKDVLTDEFDFTLQIDNEDLLCEALKKANSKERFVLLAHASGFTLKEIGVHLKLSESRTFQIYHNAIDHIQRQMAQGEQK